MLELPATGQVRARTIKLECRETTKCAGVSRRVILIFQLCGFYCQWRCGFVCGSRFRGLESGVWLKEPFAVPASLEPIACAVKECRVMKNAQTFKKYNTTPMIISLIETLNPKPL